MEFHKLKRKDLQALCKKHNLHANRTNVEMINDLTSLLKKPELEAKLLENLNGSDEIKKAKRVRFCIEGEEEEHVRSVNLKKVGDGNVLQRMRKSLLKPNFERYDQNVEEMGITEDPKVQKKRTGKTAEVEILSLSPVEKMKTRRERKTTESDVKEEIYIEVPKTRSLRSGEILLNVDHEKRSSGARNAKRKFIEEKKIEAEVRNVSVLSKSTRQTRSRKKANEVEAVMGSLSCGDAAIDTQLVNEEIHIEDPKTRSLRSREIVLNVDDGDHEKRSSGARGRKSAVLEILTLSSVEKRKTRRGKKTTESGDVHSRTNVNEEIYIEVPKTRSLRSQEILLNVDHEKRSSGARNLKKKVSEEKKIEAEIKNVSVLSKKTRQARSRKKAGEKEAGLGSLNCGDAAIGTQLVNEEIHIEVPKTRSLRSREILLNVDDKDHEKRSNGARNVKRKVNEEKKIEAEVRDVSVLSKSIRQTRSRKKVSEKEAGMESLSCGDAAIATQQVNKKPKIVAKPVYNAPRRSNRNASKEENYILCYEKSACLLKEKVAGSEMLLVDEEFKSDVDTQKASRKSRTAAKRKSISSSNVMTEKPSRRCRQKHTNGKKMASINVAGRDEEDVEKTKPRKQEGSGKAKTGILVPKSYSNLEEIPRRSTRTRGQTIALDSRLELSAVPNIVVDGKDFLPKVDNEAAILKNEIVATGGTYGTQPQAKKLNGNGRRKKSVSNPAKLKRDTQADVDVSKPCLSYIKDNDEVVSDTETNVESDMHVIDTLGSTCPNVSSTVQDAQATVGVPMVVTEISGVVSGNASLIEEVVNTINNTSATTETNLSTCIEGIDNTHSGISSFKDNGKDIGVQEVQAGLITDVVPTVVETFDITREIRPTVMEVAMPDKEASLVSDDSPLGSSGGPNPQSNIDATDGPVKLLENAECESQKLDVRENIFTLLEDFRYQEKEERVDEQVAGIESSGADHTKELVEISVIGEFSETHYSSAMEENGEYSQAISSLEHAPNKSPLCDSTRELNDGSVLNCTKSDVRCTKLIVAAETKEILVPAYEYPQETSSKKSTLPSVSANQDESDEGEPQLSLNFDPEYVEAESSMVIGQENLVEETAELRLQHCKSYALKLNLEVSYEVDENKEGVEALAEKSGEEHREEAMSQESQELLTQIQISEYHCNSGNNFIKGNANRDGKNKGEVADDSVEGTTNLGINYEYKDNENAAGNDNEGTLPDIEESFEGKEIELLYKVPEFTGHVCLSNNGVLGGHGRACVLSEDLCSKVVEEKAMLEYISGCKYGGNVVDDETPCASAHSKGEEENLGSLIKVADLKKEAVSETHGSFSVDSNQDIIISDDVLEKTCDCEVGKDMVADDYVEASPLLPTYSPGDKNDENKFEIICKAGDIENIADNPAKGEDVECLQQVQEELVDHEKAALSAKHRNFISVSEIQNPFHEPIVEAAAEVTSAFTGCIADKIKPGTSPLFHGSGPSVVEGYSFKINSGNVEEETRAESSQQALEGLAELMNVELQEMNSVETDKQTVKLDGCLNGEHVEHDINLGTSLLSTYSPSNSEFGNGEAQHMHGFFSVESDEQMKGEAVRFDSKKGKCVAYEENADSPSNFSPANVDAAATFEGTCGFYNANRCDFVVGVEDVGPSQEVLEELSKLKNIECDPCSIFSEQNSINDGYADGDAVSSDSKSVETVFEEKENTGSSPVSESYRLNSDEDVITSRKDSEFLVNDVSVEKTRDVDEAVVSSDSKDAENVVEEKENPGSSTFPQSYRLNSEENVATSVEDDFLANGDLGEKTRNKDSFELVLDEHAYLEKGAVGAKLDCENFKDAINREAKEWASSQLSFVEWVGREDLEENMTDIDINVTRLLEPTSEYTSLCAREDVKEEVGTVLLSEKSAEKFEDHYDDREEDALTLFEKRRDGDSLELLLNKHTYLERDSIPRTQCSEFNSTEKKSCEMKTLMTEIPAVHNVKSIDKDEPHPKNFIHDASLEPGNKEDGEGNKVEDDGLEMNVDSVDDVKDEVVLKESHLFVSGEAKECASLQVSFVELVDHQDLKEQITAVDSARLQELTSEYTDVCAKEDVEKEDTLMMFEKSAEKLDDHSGEATALTSMCSEVLIDQVENIVHGSSQQVLRELCNEQKLMVFEGENMNNCEVKKENASINIRYPTEHEKLTVSFHGTAVGSSSGCSDALLNNVVLCQGNEGATCNFEVGAWENSISSGETAQNEEAAFIQTKGSGENSEERDTTEAIVEEIVEDCDGLQPTLVLTPEGCNDGNPIVNMTNEVQECMELPLKRLSAVKEEEMLGTMSVSTPKNDSGKNMMDEINGKLSRMYISSARKGRQFRDSIGRTPMRLYGHLQPNLLGSKMKENVQTMKTGPLASRLVEKSVTKRRPLEDLQNSSTMI
ncbi:hypothetical protein FRX31_006140 [Thalictrum thalictroides]|uniref:Uncharacterized protein n=1 Tax=Thalictrum thalictroides TaxID=46969 RepID=A0A7J6X7D0_THATH|nr:hypothetical protein FRX31_006140 [Thalictrum thalictroides]